MTGTQRRLLQHLHSLFRVQYSLFLVHSSIFPALSLRMLKIGVFGAGHLGKFHLNNWKEIPGVELTGFFDPNDAVAEDIISKYALKRYTSEEELIDASDAIDVVTPTQFHFPVCAKAIKKGKHVFVEKPMANTMEEAKQLVKLAQESKIKFQVGHVERFNPAFLAAKGLDLNPMFIEVHR